VEQSISDRLLQEESKKEGAVAFHVYRAYWRAVGQGLALAILFSLLLMQGKSFPRSSLPPSRARSSR
jgi:ATP-binding cassette subfamily C (CFTR/MRP) protein 10